MPDWVTPEGFIDVGKFPIDGWSLPLRLEREAVHALESAPC